MDNKQEIYKHILLDMVSTNKHILFRQVAYKLKQEVWRNIYSRLVHNGLIKQSRDWKGIRSDWYKFTHQARRSREQFLLGKIPDIPEFDKKLLLISGIPIESSEEQAIQAVARLNSENQREVAERDNVEIVEHKYSVEEESKEILDKMEIDILTRKVNEQRYKLQHLKLIKRKLEIHNMKNQSERESFMKL